MESKWKEKEKEKEKEKKKNEKQRSFSERSPLQELKRFPRNGGNCNSNSVSVEAPKGCLRFLLSANSNSSSSSSSSSRKPQCQRKPESFCKFGNKPVSGTPNSAPNLTRLRSKLAKENDLPRVVTSRKPNKNPSFLSQWQSGKKKSSLRTNFSNPLKNSASGSAGFVANRKDLKKQENTCSASSSSSGQPTEVFSFKVSDNSNNIENCTPVGKLSCWSALDSSVFDDDNNNEPVVCGDSNSTSTTKTPPVEASVSPEIQSGVSKLFGSAATTPVCYGVSHLLSGVTDKRKCRSRGILTIGCGDVDVDEETNVCADNHGNGRISTEILAKSRPSFIPLPTEASMRWLSSPQSEEIHQKCDSGDDDQCMTLLSSSSFSLPFSPSICFPSDLVSDSEEIYDSSNFVSTSTGKTRIVLLSPKRTPNSHDFSRLSPKPMDVHLLSASPQSKSSHEINCSQKEGNFSCRIIGDCSTLGEKSPASTGFCSSGNVVQTPTSDSSSGRLVNVVQIDTYDKQIHELYGDDDLQIDSVAEFLDRTNLSPCGLMSSSKFTNFKHLNSCASWVSDSTLQNLSLSQMRISWREGLSSRILDGEDEFDCCRCLSDEEKDKEEQEEEPFDESITSESLKKNPFENDGPDSPEFLDQEPKISGKGKEKEKMFPAEDNACGAESMSIDAGGLVSSGDSDWTVCYKNHLFEV